MFVSSHSPVSHVDLNRVESAGREEEEEQEEEEEEEENEKEEEGKQLTSNKNSRRINSIFAQRYTLCILKIS